MAEERVWRQPPPRHQPTQAQIVGDGRYVVVVGVASSSATLRITLYVRSWLAAAGGGDDASAIEDDAVQATKLFQNLHHHNL